MDTWYSLSLGNASEAEPQTTQIADAVVALLASNPKATNIIAFSKLNIETGEVTAFFPPAAHALARQFNATPCEKPANDKTLGPICGDSRQRKIVFGD